jgi:hypothetical protein
MAISKKLKEDKSGGVDIPEGPTTALFLGIVHIGVQKNTYKGVTSYVDQALLQFELQDVLLPSGNPIVVSKIERNSLKKKANMLKFGEAMKANTEEGMDFDELVGKPLTLNMGKNEAGTRVVIKSYGQLHPGLKGTVKPLMGTPRVYLDVDQLTEAQVSELPEFVQKMINERVKGQVPNTESGSSSNSSVEL